MVGFLSKILNIVGVNPFPLSFCILKDAKRYGEILTSCDILSNKSEIAPKQRRDRIVVDSDLNCSSVKRLCWTTVYITKLLTHVFAICFVSLYCWLSQLDPQLVVPQQPSPR